MCDDLLLRFSRFFSLKMSPINMEMNIFANENKILTKSISKETSIPTNFGFFCSPKNSQTLKF